MLLSPIEKAVDREATMHSLISVDDLWSLLRTESPVALLDVRWTLRGSGKQDYDKGHIENAVFVDLDAELADPPVPGGRHPLPDAERLQRVFRQAGVRQHVPVVVYDGDSGSAAARAWWLLRWAGHSEVMVVDGGYAAWVARGLPVNHSIPRPEPGDFSVFPGQMPVVDAEGAAKLAREGFLLDARAPERYRGEVEPIDQRAGHVPGAVNAPNANHVNQSGRWHSPAALADYFSRLGIAGSERIGAYCGSGVTACSVLLALEYAGIKSPDDPAELYPGSWSHWSADPDRPVAVGQELG